MSRKPKHGYYVKGHFVAYGSELDIELNQRDVPSKSDLKKASEDLQKLGQDLLDLRKDLLNKLELPERFIDALNEAKRITNFEGKRRQMQYIGKLMRQLEEEDVGTIEAMRLAVGTQAQGSAEDTAALHKLELLRDELIRDDAALTQLLHEHPQVDAQEIRALIRQARKEMAKSEAKSEVAPKASTAEHPEAAPRKAKVYREIFQLLKALK